MRMNVAQGTNAVVSARSLVNLFGTTGYKEDYGTQGRAEYTSKLKLR